jgi:DNA repair photolyase
MFYLGAHKPIETWNPVVGCNHNCLYCWARRQAKRLKHKCGKCYSFEPHLHEERLKRRFRSGSIVFVSSIADLFGKWVPSDWIIKVLEVAELNSQATFFFETKNPSRYWQFLGRFPSNVILSTTIETNRTDYTELISKAPSTLDRYLAFVGIPSEQFKKHVSIEPIMDFDLTVMTYMMRQIHPWKVSMGYDNYGVLKRCRVPEPNKTQYEALKEKLKTFTDVEDKTAHLSKKLRFANEEEALKHGFVE